MAVLTAPAGYLVRSDDEGALMRSASGGAFWELACAVIRGGGAVCGCAWDEELVARHVIVDDLGSLERLQGSKYVRSEIGDSIERCVRLAADGRQVLFSGTPCQCKAACALADRELPADARGNLVTVALICHGTARPELWEAYKRHLEAKAGNRKLVDACFRDKSGGYSSSQCRYEFEGLLGDKLAMKWSTYLQDRFT